MKAAIGAIFGRFKNDRYDDYDDDYDDDGNYIGDDDDDTYEEPVYKTERNKVSQRPARTYDNNNAYNESLQKASIMSIHKSETAEVVRRSPANLEEAAEICDLINENKIIVVNLTGVDDCQRVADFISGVTYALGGKMNSVIEGNTNVFMVGSRHVAFGWATELDKQHRMFGVGYKL